MQFVSINSYDNYVSAHIDMGRLKEEGIDCCLKDENTLTVDPILTNALGGIKLMVDVEHANEAKLLLDALEEKHRSAFSCIKCGSTNLELISSARKPETWIGFAVGFFLTSFAITANKVYHCFDCGHESKERRVSDPEEEG